MHNRINKHIGINMTWLKILAMVAMIFDHWSIGYNYHHPFFHYQILMRLPGRISIPLFSFMIAYNFIYWSKHKFNYVLRILLLACVSEPIYFYYFQSFGNAFVPLAFGGMYILILDYDLAIVKKAALLLCTGILNGLEFAMTGQLEIIACALLIVVFWRFLTTRNHRWLMVSFPLMLCLNVLIWQTVLMVFISYALIALAYNTHLFNKLRINKWIGYWFYPASLLILTGIWGQS
jgi:hypothetical protein